MKAIATILLLAGLLPVPIGATPMQVPHRGVLPAHEYSGRQDQCHVMYYNYCSGWVWPWQCYCTGCFSDHLPVQYGTCFDLTDCPEECRNLEDVWLACRGIDFWGQLDIEIYCADQNDCPIGTPLAGIYGYQVPYHWNYWQHFDFGGLPLCPCEDGAAGKFIVMITDYTAGYDTLPYSDLNSRNIEAGCESEWRCAGHSFVYRNVVSYCDIYGAPGALWISWFTGPDTGCTNYPTVPPGCHTWYGATGYYSEWLIDCYVSCQGPTKTEQKSWSEIKALYR